MPPSSQDRMESVVVRSLVGDALLRGGTAEEHAVEKAVVRQGQKGKGLVPGDDLVESRVEETAEAGGDVVEGKELGRPLLGDRAHDAFANVAAIVVEKVKR